MTIATIQKDSELSPDDPAVKDLKIILLRRIAELEATTVSPEFETSALCHTPRPKNRGARIFSGLGALDGDIIRHVITR